MLSCRTQLRTLSKVIERLSNSPRYGERWGRHWLDLASYADSHGFELDYPRPNAWRYRDYVIQSFNDDKPYDQFLHEQLAGDVIAPEEPSAAVATGFLAAGPWDYSGYITAIQGTAASRGTRLQDLDNMLTTVMTTTIGLTVGIAQIVTTTSLIRFAEGLLQPPGRLCWCSSRRPDQSGARHSRTDASDVADPAGHSQKAYRDCGDRRTRGGRPYCGS